MKMEKRIISIAVLTVLGMAIRSEAVTRYVDINSALPVQPFTSWGTAADNIRDAINLSSDGDEIFVADGSYINSAVGLDVTKDIMIRSVGGPLVTIIDGNGGRCLDLGNNACVISGFTIKNGHSSSGGGPSYDKGGGIYCSGIIPFVTNCIITANATGGNSDARGGGVYGGTVVDCIISNNITVGSGGGMSDGVSIDCVISDNSAGYGGGRSYGASYGCTFSNNVANFTTSSGGTVYELGEGGGIYGGVASNCTFIGNTSNSRGGGIAKGEAYNSTFSKNTTRFGGGGMSESKGVNCTFSANTAGSYGGGAHQSELELCIISGNISSDRGGGISESTASFSTIIDNVATNHGGGAHGGVYTNCVFTDNTAISGAGGGLFFCNAYNCEISGNKANGNGGGVYNSSAIWNCTINGNTSAAGDGGGIFYGTIYNSIVWNNTAGATGDDMLYGTSYNTCSPDLIHGVDGNTTNEPSFIGAGTGDYHLENNSPCIDTGTNAYAVGSVDLDGNPRIANGTIDMGAYEYVSVPGEIAVSGPSGNLTDGGGEAFGNQAAGVSKVLTFTVSNEDAGDLMGLIISLDGEGATAFETGSFDTTSLGDSESTTFRVTYTPLSVGSHTAAVHIASNDPDENPFDITLTGTGLANTDTDPGSDAWEAANGFDPNTSGDVMTLDSDGDGSSDIMEIYQGTERYPVASSPLVDGFAVMALGEPEDGNGLFGVSASNGVLKVRYRRSTTQTAVDAQGVWLPNLMENNWLYSGESYSGAVVTVTENVISNGPAFEIIEAASEVTSGDTGALFFTLELSPNE